MYPGSHALTQPEKPAAIDAASGKTLSYLALEEKTNRLAHLFRKEGLCRGDHVAVFLENRLEYFPIVWACLRSGLYFTPINRHLSASEAAYIVDDCDARALIASGDMGSSIELGRLSPRCQLKLSVGRKLDGFTDFEETLQGEATTPIPDQSLGSMMLYSSGTTGKPKGILRPLPEQAPEKGSPSLQLFVSMFGFDTATVYLCPAPLYHGAPIGFSNAVIQAGGTVIMMDRFDAENALKLIEQYRVTHSQWVPTMFIRMLKLPASVREKYDVSSLRRVFHAAAPCPVDVKRRMIEWWGPIIEEYYSSTESAGFARIDSIEWLEHPGSVGRSRDNAFHICDENGDEMPPGESGLIYAEAPLETRFSYHKDPEKTRSAAHPKKPEWVTVGDIGYLDESGYLYLTDRKAFMIISGGVNIYPQQIEDALALHPKLTDVAVIGVPNEDLGEEVKAIVELAPGFQPSQELAAEIIDFVGERLGRQLAPRSVDFVEEIPRMPTGKLNKKALRESYWKSQ